MILEQNLPQQKDIFEDETVVQAASTPLPDTDDDMRFYKSIQAIVKRSGTEVGSLARQ